MKHVPLISSSTPPDQGNLLYIGITQKSLGVKGHLKISLESEAGEWKVEGLKFLWLDLEGGPVPFAVEEASELNPATWSVKFLDVENPEQARELVNLEVFVEDHGSHEGHEGHEEFKNSKVQKFKNLGEFGLLVKEGYSVADARAGIVGLIVDVIRHPKQELLVIRTDTGEVFIPLAEELILSVDPRQKLILMDLPEGLVDLNQA